MVYYYPWSEEPAPPADTSESARQIYTLVRNPLTHDLGLDLETKKFCWGIRKMLLNLNADRKRMAAAEAFLASTDSREA